MNKTKNLFTETTPNTYTSVRDFPGRFFMEETSTACSGVPVQVFLRKLDFRGIVEVKDQVICSIGETQGIGHGCRWGNGGGDDDYIRV